ncbi:MAG TPA: biotin/lipoyl-binding protein [bacterium (Candidatus Stahlbacteria)]|nr:biotin/lipoyl-binding protein [Candidatus Stahlbacteria bacterium]
MAYIVGSGDQDFRIEVKKREGLPHEAIYEITIDDRKRKVSIARISPTHLSILVDNLSYDVEVERFGNDYLVSIRGEVYKFTVRDEREMVSSTALETEISTLTAPMPGLVVEVLVDDGSCVKKGDKILILEAMKMQNEIRSPKDGKVIALKVKSGDSVNAGDELAVVG